MFSLLIRYLDAACSNSGVASSESQIENHFVSKMATTFRILLAVALFEGALSASSPGSAVLISGGGSNGVTAYQAVQGDDEKLCQVLPEDADDLDRIGSITAVIEGNFLLSCGGQSMNSGNRFILYICCFPHIHS